MIFKILLYLKFNGTIYAHIGICAAKKRYKMNSAKIFKSLSDQTRLRIFRTLLEAGTELCICEIMDILQAKQYNISKHIKELKIYGLVKERKMGKFVFYKVAVEKGPFRKNIVKTLLSIHENIFDNDIKRLKKRLSLRINGNVVVTLPKLCTERH